MGSKSFYSEVSPLPGFSQTTLEECQSWFEEHTSSFFSLLIHRCKTLTSPGSIEEVIDAIASEMVARLPPDTPSEIYFAFDTLLFQAISQQSTLTFPMHNTLEVNATASDLNRALMHIEGGFNTIKLKVGVDWHKEIDLVRRLRSMYPKLRIRLDANESWSVEETISHLHDLHDLHIDYLEQPINHSDLLHIGSELRLLGTPIAADESARSISSIQELIKARAVDVFVIKPPMLGSFRSTLEASNEIKANGGRLIYTSTLDSSLNLSMAALLAKLWTPHGEIHGFSTGNLFVDDLNPAPASISNSMLNLDYKWIIHPGNAINQSLLLPLK